MNPYLNRVMIRDPGDFYGRKREVARLYARINAPRPQSVSVIGERRIGKSSLLWFIAHPENRDKYLDEPEKVMLLFLDFQENRDMKVEDFCSTLLGRLRGQMPDISIPSEGGDYDALLRVIQEIDERGLKLILLLDEFEVVTQNENFDAKFYAFLRSLANRYNVAYITTSRRQLQELCHNKQISDSPFFNIFTTLHLRLLAHEEAMEMITVPSEREGIPLEPYSDFLFDVAGTFPFFLQIACCALFEHLQAGGTMDEMGQMEVREIILEEAEPHFQYIWDRFDEPKRKICLQIVRGESISPRDRTALREMTQQGYVMMKPDSPALFSSLFAEQVEIMDAEGEVVHTSEDYAPEAIVVIDICGSTKIAHRYGAHLLRSFYGQLEGMAFEVAGRFHDRYRRSSGDGLLLTFNTVEDAVYCSIEIQRRIREYNRAVDATHRIPVRVIIHFGETLTDEKGRRHGDVVNMAFKVESFVSDVLVRSDEHELPSYDYIIVTEHVCQQLYSEQGIRCRELGAFELTGLTGLHRLYELQVI
ncbi:MAG: hypothetical protein ACE5PV_05390 [Candidatus Poribacteria bacterium]